MKTRLHSTKNEIRVLKLRLKKLESKLSEMVERNGVILEEELSADMCKLMDENDSQVQEEYKEDTFHIIFWKQQREAIGRGVKRNGIRWHPLIIKWCLYLRHQSSEAYDTIREAGCIALPSQRTLRDYLHAVKIGAGFSSEVDNQLLQVAKLLSSPKYHAIVAILIDEMTIKEDDKHSGRLVGFVNLGEINNHLLQFEQSLHDQEAEPVLAKSMIAFMVKGLFTNLRFPYAQFPCTSITGEQIFSPFWQTVFTILFTCRCWLLPLMAPLLTEDLLPFMTLLISWSISLTIFMQMRRDSFLTVRNCWHTKNRNLWARIHCIFI